MKNKVILYISISAAIIILLVWSGYSWNHYTGVSNNQQPSASPMPTPSVTSSQLPKGEQTIDTHGLAIPTSVPYAQLNGPAACRTEGTIKFLSPSSSQDQGAKLIYAGIDSPSRQIKWKVSPLENLRVGPNLMSQLSLPDGSASVGITLPTTPKSKNYKLTASMTYGRLVGEGIQVYEVNCSGEVDVILAY